MEISELKRRIIDALESDPNDVDGMLNSFDGESVYPFNEFELKICELISTGGLKFWDYSKIRDEYIQENENLKLFHITGPRKFGEKFARDYIRGKCPALKNPSKDIDPNFSGEYDPRLDGIKVEVKASRGVEANNSDPPYAKALAKNTEKKFLMNHQQLKPQSRDIFIFFGRISR